MKKFCTASLVTGLAMGLLPPASAQNHAAVDTGTYYFVGAKIQMSKIMFEQLPPAQHLSHAPLIFQLDMSRLRNDQKRWDQCNCYSKSGLSLTYVDFGNSRELGHAISTILFLEPYLSLSSRAHFTFRAGIGPAYLNRVYNEITNPENKYYSMHLSYLLGVNTNFYYSLSPTLHMNVTAQFNHISNGGTRIPNYGVNFISAGVGLEYALDPHRLVAREQRPFADKGLRLIAQVFSGPRITKHDDVLPEVHRLVTGINMAVLKPLGRTSMVGIGGEWYYDPISKVVSQRTGEDYHQSIGALSIQHYLTFGKLFFSQQVAYYITPRNPGIKSHIYQRYTLGYKIKGKWFAGVTLKTHLEVADFAAFNTGFMF